MLTYSYPKHFFANKEQKEKNQAVCNNSFTAEDINLKQSKTKPQQTLKKNPASRL